MPEEKLMDFCAAAITARKGQAVCSSLDVAEHFHKRHDNVLRDIEKIISTLEENNDRKNEESTALKNEESKDFSRLNFQPVKYKDSTGRNLPMYYMTRDGFTLLAMGFSGKEAMAFKVAYINAFNRMEKLIQERSSPAFLEMREEGKRIRRLETDAIKDFVEYARANGSHSPEWYYKSFSGMVNKIIGISARTEAGTDQEQQMQIAERIITAKIRSGIEKGRGYKEIYKECKMALTVVFA